MPLDVLVTAVITLLPLPAEGGRAACANRTQGFALRSRGSAVAQKGLASSSYDRAEVRLGDHVLLVGPLDGGAQNTFERSDHVPECRRRDMRVRLGRMNVGVTEQYLHDTRARSLLDEVRGVAMAAAFLR
jgi:hypothetical protein